MAKTYKMNIKYTFLCTKYTFCALVLAHVKLVTFCRPHKAVTYWV